MGVAFRAGRSHLAGDFETIYPTECGEPFCLLPDAAADYEALSNRVDREVQRLTLREVEIRRAATNGKLSERDAAAQVEGIRERLEAVQADQARMSAMIEEQSK